VITELAETEGAPERLGDIVLLALGEAESDPLGVGDTGATSQVGLV